MPTSLNSLLLLLLFSYTIVSNYTSNKAIVRTEAFQQKRSIFRRSVQFGQQQLYPFATAYIPTIQRLDAFIPHYYPSLHFSSSPLQAREKGSVALSLKRYGPVDDDMPFEGSDDEATTSITTATSTEDSENETSLKFDQDRIALRKVVDSVLSVKDPQHIPSILTKNIELILSCMTTEEYGALLIEGVIEDILIDQPDSNTATSVLEVIDIIISFGEDFVQHTSQIEKQNQLLLGKIIKIMAVSTTSDNKDVLSAGSLSREEELDLLFEQERQKFTPGSIRHIENECQRIVTAKSMSVESTRLLETLRIIQTRVLEEVCAKDLGEAAQVLGQIIGYDTKIERISILDAGLMVRGIVYAKELYTLTTEALFGFQNTMHDVDPDLIDRVQQIHDHLQVFIKQNESNSTGQIDNAIRVDTNSFE